MFIAEGFTYVCRALKDAECAVTLAPEWPKGYFRKGRALAGLKVCAFLLHS